MSNVILILGTGLMQMPAIEKAKSWGWKVLAADGNPDSTGAAIVDDFWPIDLKDEDALVRKALDYSKSNVINGVITVGTDFSTSVAAVSSALGLPGHDYRSSVSARNKSKMRETLKRAGINIPKFAVLTPDDDPEDLVLPPFPLVLKPVDNMGGRGVVSIPEKKYLKTHLTEAFRHSHCGMVILEQQIIGREYSIDALVMGDEIRLYGIADRHIYFPPYFIEMGHTMPSVSSARDLEIIAEEFKKGVKALGLTWGAAKGDILFDGEKAYIGEIAARLSGGFMSGWTYPYSSGESAVADALRLAVGDSWSSRKDIWQKTSAERAGISIPGIIEEIHQDHDSSIHCLKTVFFHRQTGDSVRFPRNNVEKIYNCISASDDYSLAVQDAEKAVSLIRIRLRTDDMGPLQLLKRQITDIPLAYQLEKGHQLLRFLDLDPENADFDYQVTGRKYSLYYDSGLVESIRRYTDWNHLAMDSALSVLVDDLCIMKRSDSSVTDWERMFWLALIRGGWQGADWFCRVNQAGRLD